MSTIRPLEGTVVADFPTVLVGPPRTMTLVDLGVAIVKVVRPRFRGAPEYLRTHPNSRSENNNGLPLIGGDYPLRFIRGQYDVEAHFRPCPAVQLASVRGLRFGQLLLEVLD